MEIKFCTVTEAAKILGLTEYTVRKKIREGDLKGVKESDREGYKIPYEELIRYAQENRRSGIGKDFFEAGITAMALPFVAGFGVAAALSSLSNKTNKNSQEKIITKKIRNLSIESLRDEIEATQYYIQALEIDGDKISNEDKKRVLQAKAKIKFLEHQIKEIELKYEINSNE